MTEEITKHVFVSGRVQGVGFRAYISHHARELDIRGWVKNLPDGRVEAVFSGGKKEVDKILSLVDKGPRLAVVERVRVKDYQGEDDFTGFRVRY